MRPHTPGPWEARLYEPESAEYEDGLRAYVANRRERIFVADVLEVRNAAPIAAVPDLIGCLAVVLAQLELIQRGPAALDVDAIVERIRGALETAGVQPEEASGLRAVE